jgi:hypothetical protein
MERISHINELALDLRHFVIFPAISCCRGAQRYRESMSNELETLQAAYLKVAALVIEDSAYLPVFERIEHEIAILKVEDDTIRRARAVAASYKAVA